MTTDDVQVTPPTFAQITKMSELVKKTDDVQATRPLGRPKGSRNRGRGRKSMVKKCIAAYRIAEGLPDGAELMQKIREKAEKTNKASLFRGEYLSKFNLLSYFSAEV